VLFRSTALVLLLAPAAAWQTRVLRSQIADRVAIDRAGNVFAAVVIPHRGRQRTIGVVKLDHTDGVERWRRRLHGAGRERSDVLYGLATDMTGDVIIAGSLLDDGYNDFFVARLSARNGSPLWRASVHGRQRRYFEEARAVAVDRTGDVIAAGMLEGGTSAEYHATQDFAVVKLAGNSGAERWRFLLDGSADQTDEAYVVSVDGAGDIIAAGVLCEGSFCDEVVTVVKLAGADGHLLWRQSVPAWRVNEIAVDGDGNALIAVSTSGPGAGNDFGVFKLESASGQLLWGTHVSASAMGWEEAFRVGVVASGDVFASGFTADDPGSGWLTAVRLDGATGAEVWRHVFRAGTLGSGRALALTDDGDVVVGGTVPDPEECYDLAFVRLRGLSGDIAETRSVHATSPGPDAGAMCDPGPRSPPCGGLPMGMFEEALTALATDRRGRLVVAGMIPNMPCGQRQGFVATARFRGR